MQEGTIRLLRVVVAAALINAVPDGRANSITDNPGLVVNGQRIEEWEEWSTDSYFIDDYTDDEGERSESSDSGGGDSEPIEEQSEECAAIASKVDSSCNLSRPPILAMNGCGSEGSELVPDYLIINFMPVFHLGPIFTGACNRHDTCYGTYPADKNACDMILYTDMVEMPKETLTSMQWTAYQLPIRSQAYLFSNALQSPFLAGASGEAFASAQGEGACRYYAAKARDAGCTQ